MIGKEDDILKHLTAKDVPEGCEILFEYLSNLDLEALKKEKFYVGDGLDLFRYVVKHLGGLPLRIPRIEKLKYAYISYFKDRMDSEPGLNVRRLMHDTKLDDKTIRKYLSEAKKA
jgi:hypothetical protein